MSRYFDKCRTAEEGKHIYRDLAKKYHPDNSAEDAETMKDINAQFTDWWSTHKDIHTNMENGTIYEAEEETEETAEDFIEIIRNLSTIPDITVEQTGSWLWIRGNTYPYRTQLLSFGCRYSGSKKAWYYAKNLAPRKGWHRGHSMKYIRTKYGSQDLKHDNPSMLAGTV